MENWLRNIRDTYRLHRSELNVISDPIARQRRLVEVNVIEQCLNIFKTAVVQRKRVETYELKQGGDKKIRFTEPRIHGFVYEPTSGDLKKLEVDFGEYMTDLRQVYDLYKPDGKPGIIQHLSMLINTYTHTYMCSCIYMLMHTYAHTLNRSHATF